MTYRDRRLAKAERLQGWSAGRQAKSAAAFGAANRLADSIPLGQPILVGHHSERHARADQSRIHGNMAKGCEHQAKAEEMASRAAEIVRQADNAIYDDDPDAIQRLAEKILLLEDRRETMKTRNAAYRKEHGAELKAMTSAYQREQAMPHQPYELTNLGGNIARCRQRLASLQATTVASQPA